MRFCDFNFDVDRGRFAHIIVHTLLAYYQTDSLTVLYYLGYPCVLPLVFVGDSWSVNNRFEETPHLRQEIKRINKAVKEHHLKVCT